MFKTDNGVRDVSKLKRGIMKIVFDASIHLGQFSLGSEDARVACKNSQVRISTKGTTDVVGVVTFEENSWVDHIIWQLQRDQQDAFYPFMDVFHSVKNIDRIPLSPDLVAKAHDLSSHRWWGRTFGYEISNALTRAVAHTSRADVIHTRYRDLLRETALECRIPAMLPPPGIELVYPEPDLENHYQTALQKLRADGIDLLKMLMQQKRQ
jgi:hypothetical protein